MVGGKEETEAAGSQVIKHLFLYIDLVNTVPLLLFFRCLDKERQDKYKQELKEIEERVQSRPLLLEQTSLKSVIRSAESKYTAALKKAGLSENDIQALTAN